MTPNEATIVGGLAGGILGAVASVFTTRYLVKHGPNYEGRIAAVNATLDQRIAEVSTNLGSRIAELNTSVGELTRTHSDALTQQASFQEAEVARQIAERWRPEARIDVVADATSLTNFLVLKAAEPFTLIDVQIQGKGAATLASVAIDKNQKSTGFRIPVAHTDIIKVKQSHNLGGLQNGATGQLAYRVERFDRVYSFLLSFTTEDVSINSTLFIKLIG
jgi:hypothetical protein